MPVLRKGTYMGPLLPPFVEPNMRVRLFATVIVSAACIAMVSYWAYIGNRAVNPRE
jgi:hypothetical protein